jgi:hypothetical protein
MLKEFKQEQQMPLSLTSLQQYFANVNELLNLAENTFKGQNLWLYLLKRKPEF